MTFLKCQRTFIDRFNMKRQKTYLKDPITRAFKFQKAHISAKPSKLFQTRITILLEKFQAHTCLRDGIDHQKLYLLKIITIQKSTCGALGASSLNSHTCGIMKTTPLMIEFCSRALHVILYPQ